MAQWLKTLSVHSEDCSSITSTYNYKSPVSPVSGFMRHSSDLSTNTHTHTQWGEGGRVGESEDAGSL